jgi:hypothetical protein
MIRRILKLLFGPKKTPSQRGPRKSKRSPRIAVHLVDGLVVVHYAKFRELHLGGSITLSDGPGEVVASYAPGTWTAITTGARKIQPPNLKR